MSRISLANDLDHGLNSIAQISANTGDTWNQATSLILNVTQAEGATIVCTNILAVPTIYKSVTVTYNANVRGNPHQDIQILSVIS